jgi:hydroxyethylthiazole kinase
MALMGVAGEMTAEKAEGPGSFQVRFLDVLSAIQPADLARRARLEGV